MDDGDPDADGSTPSSAGSPGKPREAGPNFGVVDVDGEDGDGEFGEQALIALLKAVRGKFEACFPNSVHVVVPIMNHKRVDDLLLRLDRELERVNFLYKVTELRERRKRRDAAAAAPTATPARTLLDFSGATPDVERGEGCLGCGGLVSLPARRRDAKEDDGSDDDSDAGARRLACCCPRPPGEQEERSLVAIQRLKDEIKRERVRTLQGHQHIPSSFVVIFNTQVASTMARQVRRGGGTCPANPAHRSAVGDGTRPPLID